MDIGRAGPPQRHAGAAYGAGRHSLIIGGDLSSLDHRSLIGVGFAMVASGGIAGSSIGVRFVRQRTPTFNTGLYRMIIASLILAPIALATSPLRISAPSLMLLALLGVVHSGFGMTLHAHALGRVQAQDAVVFGYFEPLGSILLAAVFLGEVLRPYVVVGAR